MTNKEATDGYSKRLWKNGLARGREEATAEIIEKIDRVFCDLGVKCAYDMPSFWAKDKKGKSKYVVIPDKYHKGYQQVLEDAERRIKEIFEEAENEAGN